jgi:uncharacterized protein (UPF0262 family)
MDNETTSSKTIWVPTQVVTEKILLYIKSLLPIWGKVKQYLHICKTIFYFLQECKESRILPDLGRGFLGNEKSATGLGEFKDEILFCRCENCF